RKSRCRTPTRPFGSTWTCRAPARAAPTYPRGRIRQRSSPSGRTSTRPVCISARASPGVQALTTPTWSTSSSTTGARVMGSLRLGARCTVTASPFAQRLETKAPVHFGPGHAAVVVLLQKGQDVEAPDLLQPLLGRGLRAHEVGRT